MADILALFQDTPHNYIGNTFKERIESDLNVFENGKSVANPDWYKRNEFAKYETIVNFSMDY